MNWSRTNFKNAHPLYNANHLGEIFDIWDQQTASITNRMLELVKSDMQGLHINLREEIILELAMLQGWINNQLVSDRTSKSELGSLSAKDETIFFKSKDGKERVENTAKNLSIAWLKKCEIRWWPKTETALKKESDPPKKTLKVNRVNRNHFISKSFIKRYWSEGDKIWCYKQSSVGRFDRSAISYGKWGFERNLYTDQLEAYFGLVEGDAFLPIRMLLDVKPLNIPQKQALIGFAVIHSLRNPKFITRMMNNMVPIVENLVGTVQANDPMYMRKVYESLFRNNEFYAKTVRPLFENIWVMLKTSEPRFILPDTFCVLGANFLIMPIDPCHCFVVLPEKAEEERVVPYHLESPALVGLAVNVLIENFNSSFLGPENILLDSNKNDDDLTKLFHHIKLKCQPPMNR